MLGLVPLHAHGEADVRGYLQNVRAAVYIVSMEPSARRAAEADRDLPDVLEDEKYLSVLSA